MTVAFAVFAVIVAIGAGGLIAYHYLHRYDMGIYFTNDFFWRDNINSRPQPLSGDEITTVKQNALQALRLAFSAFPKVRVHEGQASDHTVEVDTSFPNSCGGTKSSPPAYSFVNYSCVFSEAQSWNRGADRGTILQAVGWGIGTTAAHEIGHQLALSVVNTDQKIPGKYDNHDQDDPLFYVPNGHLQWTDKSLEELQGKLN